MRLQTRRTPESGPEATLISRTRDHFDNRGYLTAREVGTGYGIADLVAYRIKPTHVRLRARNHQHTALTHADHFRLLLAMPEAGEGWMDLDDAVDISDLSVDYIRRHILRHLKTSGYVEEQEDGGMYAKHNGFMPMAWEVAAVEGKVDDWKKGAIQAKRYRLFAHRTYVALSQEYVDRVDESVLRGHGIGLIAVGDHGVRRIFGSPRMEPRSQVHLNLACEYMWAHQRETLLSEHV